MPVGSGVHAADQADVIDDTSRVWQKFGNFRSALAVLAKLEWTAEQFLAGLIDEAELHFSGIISTIKF